MIAPVARLDYHMDGNTGEAEVEPVELAAGILVAALGPQETDRAGGGFQVRLARRGKGIGLLGLPDEPEPLGGTGIDQRLPRPLAPQRPQPVHGVERLLPPRQLHQGAGMAQEGRCIIGELAS